jgi:hypothetical protein
MKAFVHYHNARLETRSVRKESFPVRPVPRGAGDVDWATQPLIEAELPVFRVRHS